MRIKPLRWILAAQFAQLFSMPAAVQRTIHGAYNPFQGSAVFSLPKNLAIMTPGIERFGESAGMRIAFPYSKILHTSATSEAGLSGAIKDYVRQHGTLDELVIGTHGTSNAISPTGYRDDLIDVKSLLGDLLKMQNSTGTQVAKRIVFASCEIFTNLTKKDVNQYRALSQKLGAEIVAATNIYTGGWVQSGRMAGFYPDGRITRDKLDIPLDVYSYIGSQEAKKQGKSSAWFDAERQDNPTVPLRHDGQHKIAQPGKNPEL